MPIASESCQRIKRHPEISRNFTTEAADAIALLRECAPGSVFLIPVLLSECDIPPLGIDSTRTLDRLHYVDLFPAEKRSDGLAKLIRAIQASSRRD